ncbi:aftiphilin a isoform X2 [Gouania willdenowi]|uniref:aftiphilin a isoform X2 n=1 Tax=Gouania willdenowi TaxID=441366 RepID=UPI0010558E45|nr:aftiphilin-like isoform X2 [Gouania willdenowi]
MEPDVLRLYASTPPPMDEAAEEEDDEFGDFGTFGGVPNSLSFTELDTPLTFDPALALSTSSPPEILSRDTSCNGLDRRTEPIKVATNGCVTDVSPAPFCTNNAHTGHAHHKFADFSAFSNGHLTQTANQDPEQAPSGSVLHQSEQSSSTEGGATQTECEGVCNDTIVSEVIADVTNGHVDGADASDRRSLGCPLSTLATPPDIGSAKPPGLEISTPPDLDTVSPLDINMATPPDFKMATPPDLDTVSPLDINMVKPPDFKLATPPDLDTVSPLDFKMATPPDFKMATPPDLDTVSPLDINMVKPPDFKMATTPDLEISSSSDCKMATPPDLDVTPQDDEDDFGDFGAAELSVELQTPPHCSDPEIQDLDPSFLTAFPGSDSFGTFSSAQGWSSFSQQQDGDTWEAFRAETRLHQSEEVHTHTYMASVTERVQQLLQLLFPLSVSELKDSSVVSLRTLVKEHSSSDRAVWMKLQDVHEAEGLRYVWGGSHCNKALLSSLGIDTRNILFTGQKKQPVIVPMFAAGLGMLEPTKEPVKFVSAAEMIASIGHTTTDTHTQESLPPVQFDWSSSGLTNPLDANGSSSVLNLDFFGPVEDSGSAPFTGVDPELFDLTTAKMEDSSSRVLDAFSRLMSTMDRTTSTRKLKKMETLSEEASSVLLSLPDLSFMGAKVLMFPSTLTPITH